MPRPLRSLWSTGRTLRRAALGSGGELYWIGDVSKQYPAAMPTDIWLTAGTTATSPQGSRRFATARQTNVWEVTHSKLEEKLDEKAKKVANPSRFDRWCSRSCLADGARRGRGQPGGGATPVAVGRLQSLQPLCKRMQAMQPVQPLCRQESVQPLQPLRDKEPV